MKTCRRIIGGKYEQFIIFYNYGDINSKWILLNILKIYWISKIDINII